VAGNTVNASFSADPTSTTGYVPGAMLTIVGWTSSNLVSFKVCNNTGSSLTPGAVTIEWSVTHGGT
jgi:hypothetical protein